MSIRAVLIFLVGFGNSANGSEVNQTIARMASTDQPTMEDLWLPIGSPPSDQSVSPMYTFTAERPSYRSLVLSLLLKEDMNTHMELFIDLIDAALAINEDLSKLTEVPLMTNWNRYSGSDLMRTTKLAWVDDPAHQIVSSMLMKAVMIVVTSMNAEDPAAFSTMVGFDEFCRSRRDRIHRMMLDAAALNERRRSSRRIALRSVNFEANIFASRLHVFCPEQFGDFDSRQLILKIRIANEQYDRFLMGGLYPRRWTNHGKVAIRTKREKAFDDALVVLQHETTQLTQGVHIHFKHEPAEDYGGVTRDWITEMVAQMQGRFFNYTEGFHQIQFSPTETIIPYAGYSVIGKILGLALIEGIPVGMHFPLVYMGTILNQEVRLEDIEHEDPNLYRSLSWLLQASEAELVGMELEFLSESFPVNLNNREGLIDGRLNTVDWDVVDNLDSIKSGFLSVIPERVFQDKLISPMELRKIFEGERDIDLPDMWEHTQMVGYNADSPPIRWLWDIIATDPDFDQIRLKKFLRFLTGLEQVPLGGFGKLDRPIVFARIPRDDPDSTLPSAHTCVYQMNLPEYSSKEILKQKLIYAIEASPQMGFV